MIVYIDQIFIINFITDYILLHISSSLTGRRKTKRNILAAVFGGLYSAFMYVPQISFLYNPFFRVVFSAIMVYISERPKKIRPYLKGLFCFSFVSMFMGGGVFAVLFMAGYGFTDIINNSIVVFDAKTPVFLLVFGCLAFLCHIAMTFVFRTGNTKSKTVKLEISYGNKKVKLSGIVDTGCMLYEPVKNRPVIIVDYRILSDFEKYTSRVCLIPYSTVDSKGSFIGFYPDYIKIGSKFFYDIAVAVCYTKAMEDKQYSAIINSDVFKEESCVA